MLDDVIYYWKMTSFMTLDGITSFLHLKDDTNTCKSHNLFSSKFGFEILKK